MGKHLLCLTAVVAQVVDIVQVTCSKEVWQHFLETVLLEEKVTIPLSAQIHERQQCRLDEVVHPEPPSWVFSGCL